MKHNFKISPDIIEDKDIPSLIQWYIDAGVDETIDDEPQNWFTSANIPPQHIPTTNRAKTIIPPSPYPQALSCPSLITTLISPDKLAKQAQQIASSCHSLMALKEAIENFDGCSLKKTATNTVFSDGNPNSDIMVIGDAPGVDEDRQGKAFAGKNGQLIDKMFHAIGLDRANDLYLSNILPWRPPGNRNPTPEEIAICMPFTQRHIALFNPQLIILLGGISANTLLQKDGSITRLRGKWRDYDLEGRKIPMRAIFHTNYLLKQPKAKRDTWHDLLEIKVKIEEFTR